MIGIPIISGVPEPAKPAEAAVREKKDSGRSSAQTPSQATTQDGITFSPKALEASAVVRYVAQAEQHTAQLREERIAQAKKNIEQGAYKLQQIVLQVAARMTGYVDTSA